MREFKNCTLVKEGTKWTHVKSDSSRYSTDIKILNDNTLDFQNGDSLYLEHLGKSFFTNVSDEIKILEYRVIEINRYFNNAIKTKYIYKFLKEYTNFKKDYLDNKDVKIQETIANIDEKIIEYAKVNKINLMDIMGKLNPELALRKEKQQQGEERRRREERISEEERERARETLDAIFKKYINEYKE